MTEGPVMTVERDEDRQREREGQMTGIMVKLSFVIFHPRHSDI